MDDSEVASLKPWEVFVARLLNVLLPAGSVFTFIFALLKMGTISLPQIGILCLISLSLIVCQKRVSAIMKWVKEHEKSDDNSGE